MVPTPGSLGSSRNGDVLIFPIFDVVAALAYLVNLASLELHVPQWTVTKSGRPKHPNRLVIDLDPGEPAGLPECATVALKVRGKLAERSLEALPVTSGRQGQPPYARHEGQRGKVGAPAGATAIG